MIKKRTCLWISIVLSQLAFWMLMPVWSNLFVYLHPIVLIIVWFCETLMILFLVFLILKQTITIQRPLLYIVTIFYSLGLLILLFFRPSNQIYQSYNLIPFHTIIEYLNGNGSLFISFYNISANIGLFIPYGVLMKMVAKPSSSVQWTHYISPFIVIAGIELLQFITHRGSLDIDDVILNVAGVYIGYFSTPIVQLVFRLQSPIKYL